MSAFIDTLAGSWKRNNSLVCVGLDPEIERFPAHIAAQPSPIFQFNKAIIDATATSSARTKPQFAHYAHTRPKTSWSVRSSTSIEVIPASR